MTTSKTRRSPGLFVRNPPPHESSILRDGTAAKMNKSASCWSFYTAQAGYLFRKAGGTAMCDKCKELDEKIEHYRQLAARVRDPLLTEGVGKMIEEMEAQKATFHPEQQK